MTLCSSCECCWYGLSLLEICYNDSSCWNRKLPRECVDEVKALVEYRELKEWMKEGWRTGKIKGSYFFLEKSYCPLELWAKVFPIVTFLHLSCLFKFGTNHKLKGRLASQECTKSFNSWVASPQTLFDTFYHLWFAPNLHWREKCGKVPAIS